MDVSERPLINREILRVSELPDLALKSFNVSFCSALTAISSFDVCHAYRPGSTWVSQQSLSVNGERTGITFSDLFQVAKSMSIKKADQIVKQINGVVNHWTKYAERTKVDGDLREAIRKTLLSDKLGK